MTNRFRTPLAALLALALAVGAAVPTGAAAPAGRKSVPRGTGKTPPPPDEKKKADRKRAGDATARPGTASRRSIGRYTCVKLSLPAWGNGRTLWFLVDDRARRAKRVSLVLYAHGMHAIDYARAVAGVLPDVKSPVPVVFAGLIDVPGGRGDWTNRWEEFDIRRGRGPGLLITIEEQLRPFLKREIPGLETVDIMVAGFSGGHRVMDNLSRMMLAPASARQRAFAKRVTRLLFMDTFYDAVCVKNVPALAKRYGSLVIRGTVAEPEPRANGKRIVAAMRLAKQGDGWSGLSGRVQIRPAGSHWNAFNARLAWALSN